MLSKYILFWNKIKANEEKKHIKELTLLIHFCLWMLFFVIKNVNEFYFDAQYYWDTAREVFWGRNILRFPETFRGYFIPTAIYASRMVSLLLFKNEYILFWIIISLSLAILYVIILPYIFSNKVNSYKKAIRSIFLVLIVMWLWGDFLAYPLSDYPTFFFLISGAVLWKYSEKITMKVAYLGCGLLAGACFYASYNSRAASLYAILIWIIYSCLSSSRSIISNYKRSICFTVALVLGMLVLAIPQMMINHEYIGKYSPKVYTEQHNNYGKNLQVGVVYGGVLYSARETYIGAEEDYPLNGVKFKDVVGSEILEIEGISKNDFGYLDLVKIFIKYPMDVISIYTRHLVSLLSMRYREVYIKNLFSDKGGLLLFFIVFWFITVLNIVVSIHLKRVDWNLLGMVFILLIPSILQFFGFCEIRFFLAVHFISYYYTIYNYDYKNIKSKLKNNAIPICAAFLIFFLLWIGVYSSILSSNEQKVLLINDKKYHISLER